MQENSKTSLRVGLFVSVALGLIATLAFVVGAQQNLFTRKTEFLAYFDTVDGLRPGNVVTVAGVNVGSVSSVEFAADGRIEVRFSVVLTSRSTRQTGSRRRSPSSMAARISAPGSTPSCSARRRW